MLTMKGTESGTLPLLSESLALQHVTNPCRTLSDYIANLLRTEL